ncbi:phosphotransferase family protein [Alphaproteobacteria bacterium]|nr:phosphotransferase family protein [Alphaproteobacteria bacterium]
MVTGNLVEIRENHGFNINSLQKWLSVNIQDFGKICSIKQFIGGQSNPTFFITDEDRKELILRKKPPGDLLPSAHAIEREYKVQKELKNTNVPCPEMLALCEKSEVIGTPFYIMRYVEGVVYENILNVEVKKDRKSIYLQMVKMLAKLHNINYEKVNLADFGKPTNYSERQIKRWEKQWSLSKQRNLPEMDAIISWLNSNLPEKYESTIVHGDFRLGNLIFDKNNKSIRAVLDWELSTLGDPLADFGYMLYPYYIPIGERHGIQGCNTSKENIPEVDEVIETYCSARNIKIFDPTFYVVLSMFRTIAILEGVYARYIHGNESSPNAKDIGSDVVPLAKATFNLL